jgi:hypothetical protein
MRSGCWEYTGRLNQCGYGPFRFGGLRTTAHRAAWIFANGAIPDGLQVHHRCDNPPCVNPDHLWLGTQKENMEDAAIKGRMWNGKTPRGNRPVPKYRKPPRREPDPATVRAQLQALRDSVMKGD